MELCCSWFDGIRKSYKVRDFENNCKKYFNVSYAHAVSSGTAALKCALKALGIKQGDEVITQSFNFIATIEAIVDCGAIPIICEVNDDLHLDMNYLQEIITKKTKCIIPVHMLGMAGPITELKARAKCWGIPIIEDVCEAVGAKHRDAYLGTIGDMGVFSFDHGKNMTTGEGGMVITNNKTYSEFIASYSDHGHAFDKNVDRGNDSALMPGFNYRMTELQGAIGSVQLRKLSDLIKLNKERYFALHSSLEVLGLTRNEHSVNDSGSYDTYILRGLNSDQIKEALNSLKTYKLGSKNLPGALKWHCSYYWNHVESLNSSLHTKTLSKLEKSLAIPIMANKDLMNIMN